MQPAHIQHPQLKVLHEQDFVCRTNLQLLASHYCIPVLLQSEPSLPPPLLLVENKGQKALWGPRYLAFVKAMNGWSALLP